MSQQNKFWKSTYIVTLALAVLTIAARPAYAVASYARQTGLACEGCHTVFPELTPFGRLFKMNAYTLQNVKPLEDINEKKQSTLSIGELPPISAMFVGSSSWTAHGQPDSVNNGKAQNGTVGMPQQLSLFYAGRITDNVGAFLQLTYDPSANSIGMDNTDIRYANRGMINDRELIYGVTVNNNPTVQDVWNTAPAWTFPFLSPMAVPTPTAQGSLLTSLLAQQTAGVGPYVYIDKSIYAEVSAYRSAQIGVATTPLDSTTADVIDTAAPYWRLAWNHEWGKNSIMIGHWGIYSALQPGNGMPIVGSATNKYTDLNFDAQYQYIGEDHLVTLTTNFLHERQRLDGSFQAGTSNNLNHLNRESLVAAYYYLRKIGGSIGLFNLSGNSDPLKYPSVGGSGNIQGSANGSPNSNWATLELDYLPWLNTKLFIQYTAYNKFNGSTGKYNLPMTTRSASDNNTIYAGFWFAF